MTVKHLSALMSISIMGPFSHLWDASNATSKWIQDLDHQNANVDKKELQTDIIQ